MWLFFLSKFGLCDLTEMNNVPFVHMLDTLADLPHVVDDLSLRHGVAFTGDLLKEFTAGQAGIYAGH